MALMGFLLDAAMTISLKVSGSDNKLDNLKTPLKPLLRNLHLHLTLHILCGLQI